LYLRRKMTEKEVANDGAEATQDAFAFLDFDYEDVAEAERKLGKNPGGRDRRICACGHPAGRHTMVSGITFCKPSRMECPCKAERLVLESEDTRVFLRKTEGSGPLHALGRGLKAAKEAGKKVTWIIEMKCDRCEKPGQVSPVAVTQRGVLVNAATGYDALLCRKCRETI
jgi:hypothetical protein